MELHAVDVEGWMSKPHDETGGGFGGVHEQDVLTVFNGNQGIVTGQFQRSGLRGKIPVPSCSISTGTPWIGPNGDGLTCRPSARASA